MPRYWWTQQLLITGMRKNTSQTVRWKKNLNPHTVLGSSVGGCIRCYKNWPKYFLHTAILRYEYLILVRYDYFWQQTLQRYVCTNDKMRSLIWPGWAKCLQICSKSIKYSFKAKRVSFNIPTVRFSDITSLSIL